MLSVDINISRYHQLINKGKLTFVHTNLYRYGFLLLEVIRNSMNLEVITLINYILLS
jgi:hypothetical protein